MPRSPPNRKAHETRNKDETKDNQKDTRKQKEPSKVKRKVCDDHNKFAQSILELAIQVQGVGRDLDGFVIYH